MVNGERHRPTLLGQSSSDPFEISTCYCSPCKSLVQLWAIATWLCLPLHEKTVPNSSLCNLCVLCASVVKELFEKTTTETQRTHRLHREEVRKRFLRQP